MAGRLQGKTALVTGATSNIGRAIAEAFAAEGAHVVISGRSAQRGAQVVDGIRSRGGRADFVMAELDGSAEASRSLAGQATSVLGRAHRHPGQQRRHLSGGPAARRDRGDLG